MYIYLIVFHTQVTETHAVQPLVIPPTDEPSAYKLIVTEIPRSISGTIIPVKDKETNDLEVRTLEYGYMHCIYPLVLYLYI